MSLDATVGGAASDSYLTVAEADVYHNARLHNDEWIDADPPDKEKALKWATRLLDNLDWVGNASDQNVQALRWPRYDVYNRESDYYDYDIIPQWLKDATSEMAWLLIISDTTRDADTKGYHMIKVGPITLQINPADRSVSILESVMSMVNPFLYHTVRMERG